MVPRPYTNPIRFYFYRDDSIETLHSASLDFFYSLYSFYSPPPQLFINLAVLHASSSGQKLKRESESENEEDLSDRLFKKP